MSSEYALLDLGLGDRYVWNGRPVAFEFIDPIADFFNSRNISRLFLRSLREGFARECEKYTENMVSHCPW